MSLAAYEDDPFGDQVSGDPVAVEPAPATAPADDRADDPEPGETTVPRGGPVAGGRREPIPPARPLPRWADPVDQDRGDGVDEDIDFTDLAAVNRDLIRQRVRLNRVRRLMRQAAREAVEAKLTYQRALRRALVQQTGGSAESRKANAELLCEDLEADMVMRQQVADEYSSLFRAVRDDVENAKTIAYNLRALMNLI